jgi:hypothetical protein
MLTADVLTPRTNNPDEADYLGKVRTTLAQKGAWLRISQPYVRDREDPSRHVKDPGHWQLSFSLGPDGDHIPAGDYLIDRDELLKTTVLGAGYYTAVHTGPMQTKLKKSRPDRGRIRRWLRRAHAVARALPKSRSRRGGDFRLPGRRRPPKHRNLGPTAQADPQGSKCEPRRRRDHRPGLSRRRRDGGNLQSPLLADYAEKSSAGAASAVKILEVVKTAAQVVETGLTIFGVGAGIRALRVGGEAATGLARHKALEEATEKLAVNYAKKNGISAAELSIPRYVPQPPGTKLARGFKPGQSTGHAPASTSGEQNRYLFRILIENPDSSHRRARRAQSVNTWLRI